MFGVLFRIFELISKNKDMTTLTIELPENDEGVISKISDIVKKVKGSRIDIDSYDDGFTEDELSAVKRGLKEVAMIKKGELKPLSMDDLWDE